MIANNFCAPASSSAGGLPRQAVSQTRFEQLLQNSNLPAPGPDHYNARRRLWLKPGWSPSQKPPKAASPSRQKLEAVLNNPNMLQDIQCWRKLDRVWKNLSNGSSLNESLPMSMIIRIVHAAWVRDNLWPAGVQAPEPDDELPPEVEDAPTSELQLDTLRLEAPPVDPPEGQAK
ncbi:hypothetical protein CC1G_01382 [Coprinopsis cinerea okayama7|uniref:DUF4050 domain-containing protein n=1 Tax=Coprinopsis cinerea (strain Okayama-7 / 130 / ATCC MYA-4618 / FGSC 9003) TaxID=240176 RepID=A8NYM7_COPC7|nr:hypothetical protein CC1G_01382 [Coprinopsis cinerea okayama7\|eukprot:XP_001837470.2 hypothetical protein CC1G_01382 [Coprinopsis cinerea okayama7\